MIARYQMLLGLRQAHAGLRSPSFYPDNYDLTWNQFSPEGFGINVGQQVVIFERWGPSAAGVNERFVIVLNFSWTQQNVNVPFPIDGVWTDLINGNAPVNVQNCMLYNYPINPYWGCLFYIQG
jgi:hypothetical protein